MTEKREGERVWREGWRRRVEETVEGRGGGEGWRRGVKEKGKELGCGDETISNSLTSGAIQGNVPTRDTFVVCRWNLEEPKSHIWEEEEGERERVGIKGR